MILSDGTVVYIFEQAKHKKNPEYIKYSTFMTNNDFKLSYYFDSSKIVEENYENVQSVLLITNNKIDDGEYKMTEIGLVKLPFNKHLSLFLIEDKFVIDQIRIFY
jgi:hypothetical protein